MVTLDQTGKGALLTVGIALIYLGLDYVKQGLILPEGVVLIVVGLALVVAYTLLVEKQATQAAVHSIVEMAKNEVKAPGESPHGNEH
jgi:membrane-bound ClpP family serine protease